MRKQEVIHHWYSFRMLTIAEVQHIATLARIGLKEEERTQYQKELSSVLDFFRALETVATDDAEQSVHVSDVINRARQDRREDFDRAQREVLLNNVPAMKEGFVKVKSVF